MKTGKNRTVAVIPAAGLGKRFSHEKKKTFYAISGKPVIIHVLETFQRCDKIDEIIPVFKEDELLFGSELIEQYGITKVKRIVPGGRERQDSVYNGIKVLDENVSVVVIHDGVRPLIETGIIENAITELKNCDGVIVAVPVKDTIKEQSQAPGSLTGELSVKRTLDRRVLWSVQTPQVFLRTKIQEAHEKASAEGHYATDDAALIERYGGKVKIVTGSYRNIKITTPEDTAIAEALLHFKQH